jgi:hypothetical protein
MSRVGANFSSTHPYQIGLIKTIVNYSGYFAVANFGAIPRDNPLSRSDGIDPL